MGEKPVDLDDVVERARRHPSVLRDLLEGVSSDNKSTDVRYNRMQALLLLAERYPEMLLPHWERFAALLRSRHNVARYNAVHLIATLAPADTTGRFERLFDAFYALLDSDSVTLAAHVALLSGRVAAARPDLRARICYRLLGATFAQLTPECRDLVRGYTVEGFSEFFARLNGLEAELRADLLAFAQRQLSGESPKARAIARSFLLACGQKA